MIKRLFTGWDEYNIFEFYSRVVQPYLHESRHQHAMRRARGCGGRFLNTKKLDNNKSTSEKGTNSDGSKSTQCTGNWSVDSSNDQKEGPGSVVEDMQKMQTISNGNGNSNGHGLSSTYDLRFNDGKEGDFMGGGRKSMMLNGSAQGAISIKWRSSRGFISPPALADWYSTLNSPLNIKVACYPWCSLEDCFFQVKLKAVASPHLALGETLCDVYIRQFILGFGYVQLSTGVTWRAKIGSSGLSNSEEVLSLIILLTPFVKISRKLSRKWLWMSGLGNMWILLFQELVDISI